FTVSCIGRILSPAFCARAVEVSDAPAVSPLIGDHGGRSSSSGFHCFARKPSGTHTALVPALGLALRLAVMMSPIVKASGGDMALKQPVVRSFASFIIHAARSRTSMI